MKKLLSVSFLRMFVIFSSVCLFALVAFAQATGDMPAAPEFPYIFALGLFGGMIAHYIVSYLRNKLDVSFKEYMLQSFGLTISALGAASAAFAAVYVLNPGAYDVGNVGAWIQVIIIGYTFDSGLNGKDLVKK